MTEKRKWFDPRTKPETQLRLVAGHGVLPADIQEFVAVVLSLQARNRLPMASSKLFLQLCEMPPAARLSRNLKVVLTLLVSRAIRNVLQDGLSADEKLALRDLEHSQAPSKIRAIAQGLLHASERQQLADAVQEMYRDERTRCWKSDTAQ